MWAMGKLLVLVWSVAQPGISLGGGAGTFMAWGCVLADVKWEQFIFYIYFLLFNSLINSLLLNSASIYYSLSRIQHWPTLYKAFSITVIVKEKNCYSECHARLHCIPSSYTPLFLYGGIIAD